MQHQAQQHSHGSRVIAGWGFALQGVGHELADIYARHAS
jgi:hypothetical protein